MKEKAEKIELPDEDFDKLDESEQAAVPSISGAVHLGHKSSEYEAAEMQTSQDLLLASGDKVVDPSEVNPDVKTLEEKSDDENLPEGKKEGIKAILKAFRAVLVNGWEYFRKNSAKERNNVHRRMKERLAKAEGLHGGADVEDGAIRFCLNMPFIGAFPSSPQLTLALSLAMVEGFAEGTAENLDPWLKRKSAEIQPEKLLRAFSTGQLNKAKKLVAREMFIWQNSRSSKHCSLSMKDVKSSTKYRKKCFKNKVFHYQITDCAKDRFSARFPDLQRSGSALTGGGPAKNVQSQGPRPQLTRSEHHVQIGMTEEQKAEATRLGEMWDLMTGVNATKKQRKQAKGWLKGAEKQIHSVAKHWAWALPKVTADSVQKKQWPVMLKFASFVRTQMPIVAVKLLSDSLKRIARGLSKVWEWLMKMMRKLQKNFQMQARLNSCSYPPTQRSQKTAESEE